jgi:hypothetical protein
MKSAALLDAAAHVAGNPNEINSATCYILGLARICTVADSGDFEKLL